MTGCGDDRPAVDEADDRQGAETGAARGQHCGGEARYQQSRRQDD